MILITGGIKSGKSTLALEVAKKISEPRIFIATSEPIDTEMRSKIERHKADRGKGFILYEEPIEISTLLLKTSANVTLIECMATWVNNLIHYKKDVDEYFNSFINSLKGNEIIVTNETGLGIIPDTPLVREYSMHLGNINKMLAKKADEVYLMVSGLKVKVK